jgi:hypothetical protein
MLAEALPKAWAAACQFRGHRDHGCRLAAATKKKRHRGWFGGVHINKKIEVRIEIAAGVEIKFWASIFYN